MDEKAAYSERGSLQREDLRERGKEREGESERERGEEERPSIVFLHLFKIFPPGWKTGRNLFALTFSFAKTFFYASRVIHAFPLAWTKKFPPRLQPRSANILGTLHIEPCVIRLKNFTRKFCATRFPSRYVAGECFARETIWKMKMQGYTGDPKIDDLGPSSFHEEIDRKNIDAENYDCRERTTMLWHLAVYEHQEYLYSPWCIHARFRFISISVIAIVRVTRRDAI